MTDILTKIGNGIYESFCDTSRVNAVTARHSGKLYDLIVFFNSMEKTHFGIFVFVQYFFKNRFILRIILTTIFMMMVLLPCSAQNDSTTYMFSGQILDADSIPVENVYLVNYRNVRGYATDENGKFKIPVLPGDSLKTAHVSFKSIIIKAYPPDSIPTIVLSFEDHLLFESSIMHKRDLKREEFKLNNFYRNWNTLLTQMQSQGYYCTKGGGRPGPDQSMEGFLINNFSVTGNPSLSLNPEAIYKKIRRMNLARQQRKSKKE